VSKVEKVHTHTTDMCLPIRVKVPDAAPRSFEPAKFNDANLRVHAVYFRTSRQEQLLGEWGKIYL
jgi:hypothetical protein